LPGAAGEYKRAVDVEKEDLGHARKPMVSPDSRTWSASVADCLSLAANVPRARPLGRRLFVETDALAFVELLEAPFHRAPVKEPLLAALVANEPETPVTNESLDRTAR